MKRLLFAPILIASLCAATSQSAAAPAHEWPEVTRESKPWTYWWWMGSAVTREELARHFAQYKEAGLGGAHIIPIYGAEGHEDRNIPFISPQWMEMLGAAVEEAEKNGMGVDMTLGTGWPYGGPWVGEAEAASRAFFLTLEAEAGQGLEAALICLDQPEARLETVMAFGPEGTAQDLAAKVGPDNVLRWTPDAGDWRVVALFRGWTRQQVKRAAPGGEGNVLDHFSRKALDAYLEPFTRAFDGHRGAGPRCFYLDSYEVYNANWTAEFPAAFLQRRGYDLRRHLDALLGHGDPDRAARVQSDYNETVGDLLLEGFTRPWVEWCRGRGAETRSEAHGSPGNLLDLYAAADTPETEGFGPEGAELLMTKFASSAAHNAGLRLVSSESCTWLREHFQETLAAVKPAVDDFFLGGVNHIFYHGTAYSPADAPWPGLLFYASTHFGPTNTFHRDFPALNAYITRCQSILQGGAPAADVLLYWPVYDLWHSGGKPGEAPLFCLSVHKTQDWLHTRLAPFHETAKALQEQGYDFDYISDKQLENPRANAVIVVPPCRFMPHTTMERLATLAESGRKVVFMGGTDRDAPGLDRLGERRALLKAATEKLRSAAGKTLFEPDTVAAGLEEAGVRRETLGEQGLRFVRRETDSGRDYFLVNRSGADFDGWAEFAAPAKAVYIFEPLSGERGMARTRPGAEGRTGVRLQIAQNAACIVRLTGEAVKTAVWKYLAPEGEPVRVGGPWRVEFLEGGPVIPEGYESAEAACWTGRGTPDTDAFSGTARYTARFVLPESPAGTEWLIDLGEVRESARVRINGTEAGVRWHEHQRLRVTGLLKPGGNVIEAEVSNLMANRIAAMDRAGVKWRNFYFVNIDYKPFDASAWPVAPSGLAGPVTLVPCRAEE